ncbi:hypothetical protein Lal_00042256 [Lupinus albus]|nr:hypothetical protein Lal_00042256 [Lupinus albus]
MRKDPKVGGGVGGTCEIAKNQTQRSPSQLLRLNAFRGEPASSGLEWHFTPNHNSSADSSTSVEQKITLSISGEKIGYSN